MTEFDLFMHMGAALAIGLLVGLARGWQTRTVEDGGRAAGFRTFALTGLLGGVAGQLSHVLGGQTVGLALIAFTAAFATFHWIEAQASQSASVTTVIAGMLTFLLGALAVTDHVQVAVAGGVAMAGLIMLREPMHRWVALITWEEIRAGLTLLAMSFLLLPLLPDRTVDPWGALNPHEVWLLAILIALISFVGYVAVRLFGDRLGILVTAAAGGLASSTATTLTLARLAVGPAKSPGAVSLLAAGVVVSGAVMLLRVGFVVSIVNPGLIGPLWLPLLAAVGILAASAFVLLGPGRKDVAAGPQSGLVVANPLALGTSLRMAGFIAGVMLMASIVRDQFGDAGVIVVAGLSGLADVDAITISLARMPDAADLATTGILLAIAVNTATKAVMALVVGGRALGLRVIGASVLAIAAGLAAHLLV